MSHLSKDALDNFLAVVKAADKTFLDPDKNLDEQGKVDGYSHLFHLLRTTIDFYLFNDPLHPSFMLLSTDHHKILGDNVDAVYYFTQLRSDQEYLIKGKRFDSVYLAFATYAGEPDGSIVERQANNINHRDIVFEEDGTFEIKLTANPKGKNEFMLHDDVVTMFTREYFFDRFNSRESELSIVNLTVNGSPKPLDDKMLADRIQTMTTFFEQSTWIAPLPVEFPTNDFLPPFNFEADQGSYGTVDNIYCFGKFKLKENECLKIEFSSPEACYWGIQTWNYLMQSMDFKHYNVGVNKGSALANEDGTYTIYVSHNKMDVANWISTAGYEEAIVFCRWLLAEEMPEQPRCQVLSI
jgi:hypothetical protein